MTHPKARTKPRRRERRSPQDRITLTDKGRALLELHDQLRGLDTMHRALTRAYDPNPYCARCGCRWDHCQCPEGPTSAHGRATPCAPHREARAAPAESNDAAGTSPARPRTPAGKSGAAPLAKPRSPT